MLNWGGWLTWMEDSALGLAIRNSGVWTYGLINLLHILGVATLFGSVLLLDLRLLGWRRAVSLASVVSLAMPLTIAGFCLAVVSGICMLATNGTEYVGNPFLPIKFLAIALAAINAIVIGRLPAWRHRHARAADSREQGQLAALGAVSLLCWFTAIGAGRMIGYW